MLIIHGSSDVLLNLLRITHYAVHKIFCSMTHKKTERNLAIIYWIQLFDITYSSNISIYIIESNSKLRLISHIREAHI